jgi:hydroxymethylglutaryl-CoA synthase
MAVEAARRALNMEPVQQLGAILVGSESKPYAVKPTGTIVAQALGQRRVLTADLEFACKAGSEAMQFIMGLIGSGMIEHGLAIGVDTAQGRPGDELEYTAASGAVAFLMGPVGPGTVAVIEESVSYVTDTGDFWRRAGSPYPRHLYRFTGAPAYFHHITSAVRELFTATGLEPRDFRYAVFHQPNPRFPLEVGRRLGFDEEQIRPGLLNPDVGNSYSASSLMGLAAVLDQAEPGDRILMASFGSGAGSDAFSLVAGEALPRKRARNPKVRELMERAREIDYALYTRFRGKLLR